METRMAFSRKLSSMLLALVLAVAFMLVLQPQKAYAMDEFTLGEPYSFTFRGQGGWTDVRFTAPESGTYVFTSTECGNLEPYASLYSGYDNGAGEPEGLLANADTYEIYDNNFILSYYIEEGTTVYLEVWNTCDNSGSVKVTVTLQEQSDPETLLQDQPCFASVNGGGTVFAFEPAVSGDHTFRIYGASSGSESRVSMAGALYDDSTCNGEPIATSTTDSSEESEVFVAELQLGRTYYLKVTPNASGNDVHCAVVAGPSSDVSLNDGDWSLQTNETWYVDSNGNLHGSAALYDPARNLVDASNYSLSWFATDGVELSAPSGEGYYALVALAADDYSSARVCYVNVFQANRLTSCKFAETNPMIVDGKVVADKGIIWQGDNSVIDPSVYSLVWYGSNGPMESDPTTAGDYTLIADCNEGSGWTGQLAKSYPVPAFTSTEVSVGDNEVTIYEDAVFSFTPAKSGSYRIAVQGVGGAGYFRVLTIGDRVDYSSETEVSADCELTAGETYYVYVDSFDNPENMHTVKMSISGHSYGDPIYQWDADGESCTATAACTICTGENGHAISEEGEITSSVKAAATCAKPGTTTYTATFSNALFGTQTKDVNDIAATGHSWGSGVVTKKALPGIAGQRTYTCSKCGTTKTTSIAALSLTQSVGGMTYDVTSAQGKTVTLVEAKNASSISIPASVTIAGVSYKVTAVGASAFAKATDATSVTVGGNVKSIGASAFAKCTKLKKLVIGESVTTIGAGTIKGLKKLTSVTVKSGKLTKAGIRALVKGSKVKTVTLSGKAAKKMKKTYKKWLGSKIRVK